MLSATTMEFPLSGVKHPPLALRRPGVNFRKLLGFGALHFDPPVVERSVYTLTWGPRPWLKPEIAIIGNLRTNREGLPKYGIYVTTEGQGLNIFARDLQLALRNKQYFKLLQALQQRWRYASVRHSLGNLLDLMAQPCIPYGYATRGKGKPDSRLLEKAKA